MPCAEPISVCTPNGTVKVRCKQCLQCRIYLQSSLTLRCLLENHLSWSGQFLTLTYAEDPGKGDYKDFSSFMKRLRVANSRQGNAIPIRFLGCGEYGTRFGRFHFHALIWNNGVSLTDEATRLWPHGFLHIGEVTPSSIRYTARYTLKNWDPGNEPVFGKSVRPPLGGPCLRKLGERFRDQNHKLEDVPTTLRWDGSTYPLDRTSQIEFMEGFDPTQIVRDAAGTRSFRSSGISAVMKREIDLIFGDPLEGKRRQGEARHEWWERVRRTNGKF